MRRWITALLFACLASSPLRAQQPPDWSSLAREGAQYLSEYLKIDTTNPPGNESRAVLFLANILRREQIPYRIYRSAPKRSNLYARLAGASAGKPIILLHHTDVVPASPEFWSVHPFVGMVKDGYLYGRGALDSKGLGIVHLMAMLALKRSGAQLSRDVIFLATAEEETGGSLGVGWMLRRGPAILRRAEYVLNEGGNNIVQDGKLLYLGVETTQKTPLWIRVTATGSPGHGSIPRPNSSVNRLIRALHRIINFESPTRLIPAVEEYFKSLALLQEAETRDRFAEIANWVRDPAFFNSLSAAHKAILRNTVSPTVLQAGNKTNVIPSECYAELDCRLLPGEDSDRFLARLKEAAADPTLNWSVLLKFAAASSPFKTGLIETIREVSRTLAPDALVGNSVMTGFTDSHYFRNLGINAYGFSPFKVSDDDAGGVHGNDERLSLENIQFGIQFTYEVLFRFLALSPGASKKH